MNRVYKQTFQVRWTDVDLNAHMRNTAYLDASADIRMMYFAENGFTMKEFERLHIGPVVMRDELEYFREMRMLERMDVTFDLAGLSEDSSRFCLRNVFYREDGEMGTRVTSTGGWFNLESRRLVLPPESLVNLLEKLRSDDFVILPSSIQ